MPISPHSSMPNTLSSPPPLSELSDSERSPRTSTSAALSPVESPSSSRASVNGIDSLVSSSCNWGCCAAVNSVFQLCAGQSFAVLNFWWVLCSAFCWVFHNKLCNFFFRCGCTWNWAGSWDRYAGCFSIFTPFVHSFLASDAMFTMRVGRDARGVQRPVVSEFASAVFSGSITLEVTCFPTADYPNFLWAADGKLFTLAMVAAAAISMRCVPVKSLLLRFLCATGCGILTWALLCMLSALAFWQLTDYPYFMWYSKPPYPNQTDCTPNPCESPASG